MSDEITYRVVLKGCKPGEGTYYVEQNLAKVFNIEPAKAKKLLESVPYTIKDDIDEETAKKYKTAVEKAGAIAEIEDNKYDFSGLSLE